MPTHDFSAAVNCIRTVCRALESANDLSPRNPIVEQSLKDLYATLSVHREGPYAHRLTVTEELSHERKVLPRLSFAAECELEKYWADYLLARDSLSINDINEFWLSQKYTALLEAERKLIGQYSFNRLVFLGSGALPLTAIIAAGQYPDKQIICVDSDYTAFSKSRALIEKLGLSDRIHTVCSDAQNFVMTPDDLLYCASMLTDKREVYKISSKIGVKGLLVRTVDSIYSYLHPDSPQPEQGLYTEVASTPGNRSHVNTSRFYRLSCPQ